MGSVPTSTSADDDLTPDSKELDACEAILGYRFRDRNLLRCCLTHASAARIRIESNERLEFLGDSVLGTVVCEMLYERFPDAAEGELTRIKSIVVSRSTCAAIARDLDLEQFMVVGRGVSSTSRTPTSILAALLEALIGGVFRDGGFDAARAVIQSKVSTFIDQAAQSETGVNFKSLLQHLTQKNYGQTPFYSVLDEKGPDHAKCFLISAVIQGREHPAAWGPSKKSAEQRAAHNALAAIEGQPIPHTDHFNDDTAESSEEE